MASLFELGSTGVWCIDWCDGVGRRRRLRLGRMTREVARSVAERVDELIGCKVANVPLDSETARWVSGVSKELAERLGAAGLLRAKNVRTNGGGNGGWSMERKREVTTSVADCAAPSADSAAGSADSAADARLAWLCEHWAGLPEATKVVVHQTALCVFSSQRSRP